MPYLEVPYLVGQGNKSECKTLLLGTIDQGKSLLTIFDVKLLGIFKERKESKETTLTIGMTTS